jgi:hypothetical protein
VCDVPDPDTFCNRFPFSDVFGVQLQYLIGIGYVYPFFIPVMLGVAVITLLYLVIRKSPLKKKRAQGRRAVRLGGLKTVTV